MTPSGPDVLLLPVAPLKRPCPAVITSVLLFVLMTWTPLLVRSPRMYQLSAGIDEADVEARDLPARHRDHRLEREGLGGVSHRRARQRDHSQRESAREITRPRPRSHVRLPVIVFDVGLVDACIALTPECQGDRSRAAGVSQIEICLPHALHNPKRQVSRSGPASSAICSRVNHNADRYRGKDRRGSS